MNKNPYNLKLVAVDMDGTFARTDYTYDTPRFRAVLSRMKVVDCQFVAASGNQHYQLRSLFSNYYDELSFVVKNGASVEDKTEVLFPADMPRKAIEAILGLCKDYPEVKNVMCGLNNAYCERGKASQAFFSLTNIYYHRLEWVADLAEVQDKILKFVPITPVEKTEFYIELFREELVGLLVPTSSGRGSVDLVLSECHKTFDSKILVERLGTNPDQYVAFGDGDNDIEMSEYCGLSYAMDNATEAVKQVVEHQCPSNDEDGASVMLDRLLPNT